MSVIVRFAPSPTGTLHLGSARTALFNFLFVRQQRGKFILRIDDTDKERSKPEFEQDIKDNLTWLGLTWDEFYRQSERTAVYKKYLEKLLAENRIYQDGAAWRFRNPGGRVRFQDLIRGEIEFDVTELKDFVIAKDLATPLYHFASVVDDQEMGITHIIRGEDHIANTPRQILICQAIGGTPPAYAHLPLILAPDRSKLSKRHLPDQPDSGLAGGQAGGAVSVSEYRGQGYLPEALINFLALLGWSPQAQQLEQEIFSLPELIRNFELKNIQPSPAIFSRERLDWFNKEHLKRLPADELERLVIPHLPAADPALLRRLIPELLNRVHRLGEVAELLKTGEWNYFFRRPEIKKEMLKTAVHLPPIIILLKSLPAKDFTAEVIKDALWDFASEKGRGETLWPMRVALTGQERSPDPFTVAAIIGKDETIARLRYAANL